MPIVIEKTSENHCNKIDHMLLASTFVINGVSVRVSGYEKKIHNWELGGVFLGGLCWGIRSARDVRGQKQGTKQSSLTPPHPFPRMKISKVGKGLDPSNP